MAKLQTEGIPKFPHNTILWKRFLDDIFMIWEHDRERLEKFLYLLNTAHRAIKFTAEIPWEFWMLRYTTGQISIQQEK